MVTAMAPEAGRHPDRRGRVAQPGYLALGTRTAGDAFMGINSLIYYVIIGWLPAILLSHGYSETQAGSMHGLLQLATAVPGLAIPLILHRLNDQRGIAGLVALMCAVSAAGFWFAPGLAVVWTLVFGFGSGATMILGLTFIGLRASSAHQAAALSGMAQSIGYLMAACGPPLMGKIHDTAGDWRIPLLACALAAVVITLCGMLAGRDREITPADIQGRPDGLLFIPAPPAAWPVPARQVALEAQPAHAGTG